MSSTLFHLAEFNVAKDGAHRLSGYGGVRRANC
jgi:hypothetical protein